jgi:putative DNA primase/helicase
MIPFEAINAAALAALPSLLAEWFPHGVRRGKELVVGSLHGEAGESLSINLTSSKWADFAIDAKGGDPISLCAAKFHAGDRVAAAKALGRKLGILVNGDAGPVISAAPIALPKQPTKTANWQSADPPPDAEAPDLSGFDIVHVYRAPDGAPVRYVGRKNATATKRKTFVPITWGELNGLVGWHKKHPLEPRQVYGLDRLAAMPGRTVIICEGEKAADAAQQLWPDYPCITWTSGGGSVAANDWAVLAGRPVVIFPDNDEPGYKCALALAKILRPIASQVQILMVDDLPEAADAADINPADPVQWLKDRLIVHDPMPEGEYQDYLPDEEPEPAPSPADSEGIVPLGYDRSVYYYLSRSTGQVEAIAAGQHTRAMLSHMASEAYYWQRSRFAGEKGVDWNAAADDLRVKCRAVGVYNPDIVRGCGAWMDNGRAVLHVGDRLIVDGKPSALLLEGSKFVYEAAKPLTAVHAEPLSTAEAHKLVGICQGPRWERGVSGLFLAGFIAIAPICGGLSWRPSIWLTGSSGSGKSWLTDNILRPGIGGMALLVQSTTSEAGIRQTLGCSARPVLFDEAEQEDAKSSANMQGVLNLIRQSSSEGGAAIVKGAANGKAVEYRVRSCWAMSSINVGIEHKADDSRITVLALKDRKASEAAADEVKFNELNRLTQKTLTSEYAAGLLSRSVRLLPVIRANAETFARAVSLVTGSRRTGDQLGTLLAGAYSLHSNREITYEAADAWVRAQDWGHETSGDIERDELRLLSHITQHRMRISQGNGSSYDVTIGRLIQAASGEDIHISPEVADLELRQTGLRYCEQSGVWGVYVSTNHPALKRVLFGTPWATSWGRSLGRLPGAVSGDRKMIRFAFPHSSRATWVPMEAMDAV